MRGRELINSLQLDFAELFFSTFRSAGGVQFHMRTVVSGKFRCPMLVIAVAHRSPRALLRELKVDASRCEISSFLRGEPERLMACQASMILLCADI